LKFPPPVFSALRCRPHAIVFLAATVVHLNGCDQRRSAKEDLSLHSFAITVPERAAEEKISPALRAALANLEVSERVRVLVTLASQLDLNRVGVALAERELTRKERRELVVAALGKVASSEQGELSRFLAQLRSRGVIGEYRAFTIVNRMMVEGTPGAVRAIATRSEVASIDPETDEIVDGEAMSSRLALAPATRKSWGIAAIGADSLWKLGLDGTGTVVGIIDPGVSATHEQLRENFRGGSASWLDPSGVRDSPTDEAPGHGTSVLSTAVGANVRGVSVGVAPRAKWVACGAFVGARYNNIRLTQCAEWMLATAQPDVLVLPWLLPGGPGCDTSLHRIVSALRAAEIFLVFAAGNQGPGAGSNRSPANYVRLFPGEGVSFAVGGITERGTSYPTSSRGANRCDAASTFPRIAAPAAEIPAAIPLTPSTYLQTRGTSVAAGFAAGAVALLRQRHPEATIMEIELALLEGARDAGEPGPDPIFGYGRLDLPSALEVLSRLRGGNNDKTKSPPTNAAHR